MDTRRTPVARPSDARVEPSISNALAYDRRHANQRAVFGMTHALEEAADGTWSLTRRWSGIADEVLCEEQVRWHPTHGLLETVAFSPSMGERLDARRVMDAAMGTPVFATRRVSGSDAPTIDRQLTLPRRGFTLASAPLEIASAWSALLRGERLRRQFLVLKVQRHAAVDLEAIAMDDQNVAIALTPVSWPLRWLFGRTVFHFRRDGIALCSIDGLLDPRDRRRNGRWHEYLGRVAFETPIVFAGVAAASSGDGASR